MSPATAGGRARAGRLARAGTLAAAGAAVLAGCMSGPDYHRPEAAAPPAWQLEEPWRLAAPADAADKGPWWQAFGDPQLDALEARAMGANQTLAIAAAHLAQARATVTAQSAGLFPTVTLNGRALRTRISANRPLAVYNTENFSTVQNDFILNATVAYEPDLAGRVRRTIEGAKASAEQAEADLANTRLVVSAELASDWYSLVMTDVSLDALERSIALQRRALEFVGSRHELGASSGLDLAQQQALLDSTLTQLDVTRGQRRRFEHAIATLVGTPAPDFSIPPSARPLQPPPIPLGFPADLLQRRPDVAAAERGMAAANAQIGVAEAAFYPDVFLTPTFGGYESRILETLFDTPSVIWAFGAGVTQTIFDGGRNQANADIARAGYDAAVANYRLTVLTAMQEVEDGITGVQTLDRASTQAQVAATSAQRVLDMSQARYEGGASTYLDVITAQQGLLNADLQAAQLAGQRQLAATSLVKALGGDWRGSAASPMAAAGPAASSAPAAR
jgi:NodT family efflux transporter outer membrane factor (OMF) lipoprotein